MNQILLTGLSKKTISSFQQMVLKLWPDSVFSEVDIENLLEKNDSVSEYWLIVSSKIPETFLPDFEASKFKNNFRFLIIANSVTIHAEHDFFPDAIITEPFNESQVFAVLKQQYSYYEKLDCLSKSEIQHPENESKADYISSGRAILDSLMEGCQIIGFDWRYKYLNPVAELQSRLEPGFLIGKKFTDVWPGVESTELYQRIKDTLEKRNNSQMVNSFEFPDGQIGYFELKFQSVSEGVLITSIDITDIKNTEKELRESEERWHFALQAADHGVWDWNLDTNKVIFSNQWKSQLGYTADEIENELYEWESRVHPDDLERAYFNINQHISGKTEFYESEFRMLNKKGSWIWIFDKGKIFTRDEKGNPSRMVGTHTDITHRKNLEADLIESERVLRESQKVAGIGSYTLDFRTGIWKSSEVLDSIFGIEPEFTHSVEGWEKIIHPEWRVEIMNYFGKEVIEEKRNFNKVYKIIRNDNLEARWVHGLGHLHFDSDGNLQQMIGTIQDITEQKEAQDALLKNQKILKLFVDHVPAAIAMFNRSMEYLAVSNRFLSDYQLEGEDIIGKSHYEVFPAIPQRWKDIHKECLNGVVRKSDEDYFYNEAGEQEWLKWEVRPWLEVNNEVGGILLFTELITEHKNMIKALEQSEERFRLLAESAPVGIAINDLDGNISYVNKYFIELFGYEIEEIPTVKKWMEKAYPDEKLRNEASENWQRVIEKLEKNEKVGNIEYPVRCKSGIVKQIDFRAKVSKSLLYVILTDLTEKHEAQEQLRRIEWMLSRKDERLAARKNALLQPYDDLTTYNKNGLIINSVGREVLTDIVNDYLSLIETSSAIYEKNGDYAFGIFSSGWCRFLEAASRKLCETDSDLEALKCGKWHCHESCWKNASQKAIETNAPVDIECAGGIRLYSLPVKANNEVIGAINFGYGNPPTDKQKLLRIAKKYKVTVEELEQRALEYETRPPYIIDSAKERLMAASKLIGEIVTRKQSEQKIIELNESLEKNVAEKTRELKERINDLERLQEATINREFRIKELRDEIELLKKMRN